MGMSMKEALEAKVIVTNNTSNSRFIIPPADYTAKNTIKSVYDALKKEKTSQMRGLLFFYNIIDITYC
jgi:putative IMPACT (imprinted ancient) family translation regulator